MTEELLPSQPWTPEMLVQFHDYFFPRFDMHDCKFDLFEKDFFLDIEDSDKHPRNE
jgi:hypothetical protein